MPADFKMLEVSRESQRDSVPEPGVGPRSGPTTGVIVQQNFYSNGVAFRETGGTSRCTQPARPEKVRQSQTAATEDAVRLRPQVGGTRQSRSRYPRCLL